MNLKLLRTKPAINPRPGFCLRLFGSPSIIGNDGAVVGGRASQRHPIALLALLARCSGRGLGREKLMSYLWPERDTDHARQLLNQAIYHVRKSLGEKALLSDIHELHLNPEIIGVDVVEFEAALDRGDHARAVGLYVGPFLDGFFLTDGLEFDRWVEREREQLAATYGKALEAVAERAERERDFARAAELWKTRAAHDPFDSRVAFRVMQALEASGHRAGALQYAGIHERLLKEELGMEASPEVRALAERLRQEPARTVNPISVLADASFAPPPSRAEQPADHPFAPAFRYVVLALLLTVGLYGVLWLRPARGVAFRSPAMDRSIAVLPLANYSTNPGDAVLADGMTEELIAMLAQTTGLRVIASTSVFSFRDRQIDVRSIADSLGVAYVLEGGLQKSGSRLRVQLRLLAARDGSTLWSETYDRELRDVFAVQDEIAGAVARELGLRFRAMQSTPGRLPTQNVAAYELYIRGSDRFLHRSDSAARQGLEFFRQAIALDSSYTAAWAGLAKMYIRVAGAMPMPDRERYFGLADAAARKAVALDDSLAEAHETMALVRMAFFDFASTEEHLAKAIALDPNNALIDEWRVTFYLWTGRPAAALAHAERALNRDPISPYAHAEVARALLGNDRCDEALLELEKLLRLQPPLLRAGTIAAQCYARKQMWPQAIAVLRPQAVRGEQTALAQLGYVLARAGQREEALRVRDTLLERWRRGDGAAFDLALVYAGVGDLDQFFVWFDRSITDRSFVGSLNPVHGMIMGPLFEDVRRDPRFERMRERLGLPKS